MKIGYQIYSARDDAEKDLLDTLKQLKAMGYEAVELAGLYGKTAQEALNQARTKEYGNPWLDSSLPVFYVGVNYDPSTRGIDDPLVEPAQ